MGGGGGVKPSSKLLLFLLKQSLKIQEKLKEVKFCIKMQSIHVFLDIAKFDDFQWKIADVSRNQGVCHVIQICFWSF